MAEPRVGMAFGTYNTLARQNEQYYKKGESNRSTESSFGKTIVKITDMWFDPNKKLNKVFGHRIIDQTGGKYPQDEAQLSVMYGQNPVYDSLLYSGSKRTENNDFIFERIMGTNTYAQDIDHDGFVGEDEIFRIE